MKKIIFVFLAILLLSLTSGAQNCNVPVRIYLSEDFSGVPVSCLNYLDKSLERIATQNGVVTDLVSTPFVVTVHVDVLDKHFLAGPPAKHVYKLGVTLFLADTFRKQKYASHYFELDAVGNNETKAYMSAFRNIAPKNGQMASFFENGKKKMIAYFDSQYPNIIKEAKRQADMQQYESAIAMLMAVPSCSKGVDECTRVGMEIYVKFRDRINNAILTQAEAVWATGQTEESARQAASLLVQIDPESSAYDKGTALLAEIKKQIRSDIDFEMHTKYDDALALEKQRLECARAVGVAYGNNQQPQTTNLTWLK